MIVTLKPYIVRFSPDYDQTEHGQPRDVVQLGAGVGLSCHCCGERIGPSLALVHRGRNLRGETFEKVYSAWHFIGGGHQ